MAENQSKVFRKKALERISSPEQLTDYLHVTNPGIWIVFAAVILLLAGIFAWAAVGTLQTKTDVKVLVNEKSAMVVSGGDVELKAGMSLFVGKEETALASVESDDVRGLYGVAAVNLPNGIYEGVVVTETVHPIEFLLKSK